MKYETVTLGRYDELVLCETPCGVYIDETEICPRPCKDYRCCIAGHNFLREIGLQ